MEANDFVVANYLIKYSGTPEQVRKWILENNPEFLAKSHDVFVAKTNEYLSIAQYLNPNAQAA